MTAVGWFAAAMILGLIAVIVTFEAVIPRLDRRRAAKAITATEAQRAVYPPSTPRRELDPLAQMRLDLDDMRHDLAHVDRALHVVHRRLSRIALATALLLTLLIVQAH